MPNRHHVLFTGFNKAMAVLDLRRSRCWIEVGSDRTRVRMSVWFRADVATSSLVSARLDDRRVTGWGVHGWRGQWLLNGSSRNIVRIEIDPHARARLMGFPVRLRCLRIAVEDPAALVAAVDAVIAAR